MGQPGNAEKSDGEDLGTRAKALIADGAKAFGEFMDGKKDTAGAGAQEGQAKAPEETKAEVKQDAKVDRVKQLSGMKLEEMKAELEKEKAGTDVVAELLALKDSIDGKGGFTCEAPFELKQGDFDKIKDEVVKMFPATAKFEKMALFLQADEAQVKEIMAYTLVNGVNEVFKAQIAALPRLAEFAASEEGKKVLATLKASVVLGKGGKMEVTIDDGAWKAAYDDFIKKAPGEAKEADDGKPKAGEARLKELAGMNLEGLKTQLQGPNLNQFLSLTNLEGLVAGNGVFALPSQVLAGSDTMKLAIFGKLNDANIPQLLPLLGLEGVELPKVKDAIAELYKNQIVAKVRAEYKANRAAEFLQTAEGKKFNNLKVSVTFGASSDLVVKFDQEFTDALKVYTDANTTPKSPEELAKEAKKTQTAEEKAADDAEKVNQLVATPIGKVLGFLGYGSEPKPPETMTGFQKIIAGTDPIGAFILGLFGYKQFVGDSFDGLVDMLPAKMQAKVKAIAKSAERSNLYNKEGAGKPGEAPKYAPFNLGKFTDLAMGKEGAKIPENGLVLADDVDLKKGGVENVTIKVAEGGEVIIPKGVSDLRVNGVALDTTAEAKSLGKGENHLEGTLPKSTVIKGAVSFVPPEATDTAKV